LVTTIFAGHDVETGATLSSTVTVAVAVETLPLTSVTVSVTVFAPIVEQSND